MYRFYGLNVLILNMLTTALQIIYYYLLNDNTFERKTEVSKTEYFLNYRELVYSFLTKSRKKVMI